MGTCMKFHSILAALLIGAPFAARAQETTAPAATELTYSGKPITLPFHCTDQDIQWAGLTCTPEEPCPIYLELSSAESAGDRVFVAGNLHAAAVTLYSTLLASEDGGRTWTEPTPRKRGAILDRIEFLDRDTGWVSGHTDFPLPRDPYLLATRDGGKTWQEKPIFSESAEDPLGMIQQFFFSAKDDGSLVIDRGHGSADDRWELYQSPDAGSSWTFKQSSSQPLKLKQAFVPSPDWRLRADARSKSFHIEHKDGEGWTTLAAFAVNAGACRPEP